ASSCVAHRLGNEESYPGKRTKKEKKSWDVDVFLLEMNGRFAIEKREDKGLLAGLYQFPNIPERTSRKKREKWLQERGLILCEETPLGEAKHVFTHLIWNMRGFRIRVQGKARGLLFLSPKEIREGYSIPSAFSYYLKQLD
ncbi:MAG: NUDIX domain-containing protein, partial [Bacilli bacterium]|nr:NUDIX domain-containing protein [Bacilli bacterium]